MFESIILTAFVIGLISALSLPMGAVTTFSGRYLLQDARIEEVDSIK